MNFIYMYARIKNILAYYDSEPTEITHGIIWLVFFPAIYLLEHGFNFTIILSMIIGFCALYAVAYLTLAVRKTLAVAMFLFSLIALILFFSHGDYSCPTHWGWALVSISAFFNLQRITNHYYRQTCTRDEGA